MHALDIKPDLEALEIELLQEAIFRHHGYDFREYAPASFKRRVLNVVRSEGLATVSGLTERLLHDPTCLERFLLAISVNVTTMFRDPGFFRAFRNRAVPLLRTYPFLRIWHAGCSTGEEVYSLAILLEEEGLYDRCRIYATDLNEGVLRAAREGIVSLSDVEQYANQYREAGGRRSLAEYYTSAYGHAIFRSSLQRNIVFSPHNLAMDGSFNEFHAILCRNVLIYFRKSLQQRVHELLYSSLIRFGILGLGSQETLRLTPHEKDYVPIESDWKLFRRVH